MSDTDSRMMRRQQDRDTAERIAPDERAEHHEAADTDPQSEADRETANAGATRGEDDQMDAILRENAEGGEATAAEGRFGGSPARSRKAGLAREGRSRLDD